MFAAHSIFVTAAQRTGSVQVRARGPSPVGLFGQYDGNVVGGLLLGGGMVLAGACPGTVLAQIAVGVRSGYLALAGGAAAGLFWTGYLRPALSRRGVVVRRSSSAGVDGVTVFEALGVSQTAVLVGFEAVCAAVVVATLWTPLGPEARLSPVLGGFFIGLTQLLSILARGSLLSVSTSYEEAGEWAWRFARGEGKTDGSDRPGMDTMLFSLGIVGGAWGLAALAPALAEPARFDVSPASALAGGFLMILGARIAGGCTSGHGISGVSLLSISSFITIAATFAGGGLLALLLK